MVAVPELTPDQPEDSGPPSTWPPIDPFDAAAVLAEYLLCAADPAYFIARYVWITHPTKGVIPFDLWDWQWRLIDTWQQERLCIVLKARQMGVSELIEAYALWLVRFHGAKTVLFISKNEDGAKELLTRLKFAYAHLPPWLQIRTDDPERPQPPDLVYLGQDNTSTFGFFHYDAQRHAAPSVVRSLPATASAGRSSAASLVVLDEWAHEEHDAEIWAGVLPTISTGGKLIGISTANGLGNVFHHVWTKAETRDNGFKAIFLPWSMHPERDEAWYAAERQNYPDEAVFHQEYPSDPVEAFIQSGRPVFDQRYLQTHRQRIESAALIPLEEADGLTVWEPPTEGHTYLIGADVSGGAGIDYDAAVVLDRTTGRQAAELRGHWAPDVYARKLWALGLRYGVATLAVEQNNRGQAILLALTSGLARPTLADGVGGLVGEGRVGGWGMPLGYPKIYHRVDALVPGQTPAMRPGWDTNGRTKPLMIEALQRGLRDQTYQPQSRAFLAEAQAYQHDPDNAAKMQASRGSHDDLVIAHAIAVYLQSEPDAASNALSYMARRQELVEGHLAEATVRQTLSQTVSQTVSQQAGPTRGAYGANGQRRPGPTDLTVTPLIPKRII